MIRALSIYLSALKAAEDESCNRQDEEGVFFVFPVELACDAWLHQQMYDKHPCMSQPMKV